MISRLLPADTRIVELASGWAFTMLAVALAGNHVNVDALNKLHDFRFWAVVLGIMGGIQLYAVIHHIEQELLRCFVSWFAGALWVWLSITESPLNLSSFTSLTVGVGNFYAFVLNINLLRRDDVWNRSSFLD